MPIRDTMTPREPSYRVSLKQWAYCHQTKQGVSLSEGLKVERWGDDVTLATDGWLGESGVGRLRGLSNTLALLFSAHSQWPASVQQSSL